MSVYTYGSNELYHYGVKGMRWGVRRYQNEDGSLTDKGRKRYIDYSTGELTKNGKKRLAKVGENSNEGKYIRREKMAANVERNWYKSYNSAADVFESKLSSINKKYGADGRTDNKQYMREVGKAWKDAYSKALIRDFGPDPVTNGKDWVKNAPFMDDYDV